MAAKSIHSINGKKVVDADYRTALVIEKRDIVAGKSKEPDSCAAAQACVRQFDALSAHVFLSRTYIEYPKRWVRFRTPQALRTEMISFDRGHKFTPGTYILSPLSPSELPNGSRKGTDGEPRTKRYYPKKRAKAHKLDGVRHASDIHHMFTHKE